MTLDKPSSINCFCSVASETDVAALMDVEVIKRDVARRARYIFTIHFVRRAKVYCTIHSARYSLRGVPIMRLL